MCKVQWSHHIEEEATCEREEELKAEFPSFFFQSIRISGTRFILTGGGGG
jgi:hypothetical protein